MQEQVVDELPDQTSTPETGHKIVREGIACTIGTERFIALSARALWWPATSTLVVSDLHFGKASHFRRHGIPIPLATDEADLTRLGILITQYAATRLLIVGDLVHSKVANEWEIFCRWREQYDRTEMVLIKGNHDRFLTSLQARSATLEVTDQVYERELLFVHEPSLRDQEFYTVSGHIHPALVVPIGVRTRTRARCFLIKKEYALLPAFGEFTGSAEVTPKVGDLVIPMIDDEVWGIWWKEGF